MVIRAVQMAVWQRQERHPRGDDAACEGFFGLLKRERIYHTAYPTLDAARSDVFEYIKRRHYPRMRRRRAKQDQKFLRPFQTVRDFGVEPYAARTGGNVAIHKISRVCCRGNF